MKTNTPLILIRFNAFVYNFFKHITVIKPLLLLALLLPAIALAEDFSWTNNGDGTCTVTGYSGAGGDVVMPKVLGGLTVSRIGGEAFSYCSSLTNIKIPDSIVYIGNWAFGSCINLAGINIHDGVTKIGAGAFHHCYSLTNISIGKRVTYIGEEAFYNCSGLKNINIPDSVTKIGNAAFGNCDGLTHVTIGNGVTYIGEEVFYNCSNLKNISIPDSVTAIKDSALDGCDGLIHVKIGDTANAENQTMALWPSSSLGKIIHSAVPGEKTSRVLSIRGAKTETVSAQAVFKSPRDVNATRIYVTALEHTRSDRKIPASAIKFQWVRCVDTPHNAKKNPGEEPKAKTPEKISDPSREELTIQTKAGQAQPIGLEIKVPHDAESGDYTGKLIIIADGKLIMLPVELLVMAEN